MATRRIGNVTINYTPTQDQTQMYNMLGRDAGQTYSNNNGGGNFFENIAKGFADNIGRKANAVGNTFSTTLSAPVSIVNDLVTSADRGIIMKDNKNRMNEIAQRYGYNTYQDVWDARDLAEQNGDTETLNKIDNVINPELQSQATANKNKVDNWASKYEDYRKNDFISNKINQDRGKYLGDSITTLSTAADIAAMGTGLPMGVVANTIQGGAEGLASELSENGFQNFDWDRAKNNMITGAVSGAATAGLNKMIPAKTATQAPGILKSVAQGAGRGALSGAVGGAAGAATSSALNGQDLGTGIGNTLAGALQGSASGAFSGGVMGGANALGNKVISSGLGRAQARAQAGEDATAGDKFFNKVAEIQNTGKRWTESGDTFMERFRNTRDSGDSAFGNIYNNYKYAASIPDSEDGYKQGYVTMPSTSAEWKRIKNDTQGMISDIANRVEELQAQEADSGKAAWMNDAFEYDDMLNDPQARKIIDELGLTTKPKMAQAAAITQYLRDNGIVSDEASAYLNNAIGLEDLNDEQLSQVVNRLDTMKRKAGSPISEEYNRIDRSQYLANEELGKRNFASGLSEDLPDSVREYLIKDYELRDVPYDSPRGQLKMDNYKKIVNQLRKDYSDKQLAKFIQNGNFDADTQALFETAIEMPAPARLRNKRGFAMLPNTSDDWKEAKMAEEARSNGMSVLKSMSKAELQDELRNFDYPEEDIRGLSKKDMIEVLDEMLPYGAEAYAGGNDSTGRVDAEKYVRSLTADSLRDYMINEEGFKPEAVPKSKSAMLRKLGSYGILSDLIGESYKPKAKYQQDYLVEGQLEPYDTVLNRSIEQGLSGPELADVLADYSELPSKVTASQLYKMAQKDPALKAAISYTAAEVADSGEKPTYQSIAKNNWNEVRSHYVQDRRYNGPGSYYDNSDYEPYRMRKPTRSTKKGFAMLPNTSDDWKQNAEYSDDINGMYVNRNDMLDTTAESPETELYRQLTGNQERSMQSSPVPTTTAGDAWDGLAREYGYASYDDAIKAYAQANPNKPITAGAVTTWLDANEGTYNPNALRTISESEVAEPMDSSLEKVFKTKTNKIQKRNKAQSIGNALENAGEGVSYREVYDALDPKTATRAQETKAVQRLAEMDVKPRNYEEYAKTSSEVNRVASELADKSGVKVIAPDLATELSPSNLDVNLTDDAAKTYNNYVRQIVADGSNPDEYSAGYLLEKSRWLGDKAEKVRGSNADDIKQALRAAKWVVRDKVSEAMANSGITGEGTTELLAQDLKNLGANQKVIDYYTAPGKNGKAPNISELINRSSLFEQARDMGTQIGAEAMTRSASKYPASSVKQFLRTAGLDQLANVALDQLVAPITGGAMKLAGKGISAVGNAVAGLQNGGNANANATIANNPQTRVYDLLNKANTLNIIGRNAGEEAGGAITPKSNNASAAGVVPLAPNTGVPEGTTLEDLAGTSAGYTGTDQNTMANTLDGGYGSYGSYGGSESALDPTAALYQTAMKLAMEAGDADAYAQLYQLYANAVANSQKNTTDLTVNQQNQLAKIASAEEAVDQMEQMLADASGAKGVIGGTLQGWAGNIGIDPNAKAYNDMVTGFGNEISKVIGKQNLPQITDDAETAAIKIQTLRDALAKTKANYYKAYGLV